MTALGTAIRLFIGSVVSPWATIESDIRFNHVALLLALVLVFQSAGIASLHLFRPKYLVAQIALPFQDSVHDHVYREHVEVRLRTSARQAIKRQSQATLLSLAWFTGAWYLFGLVIGARARSFGLVVTTAVVASVVWSLGIGMQQLLSVILDKEVGTLTLSGLAPSGWAQSTWLARVSLFTLWAAVVAGGGLADAWRRGRSFCVIVSMSLALLWMIVVHGH